MAHIIAGRFQTKAEADTVAATIGRYADRRDICIFHNNPPGQHGTSMAGRIENVDPAADGAAENALGTAMAAGLAAGVVGLAGGPVTALAAAGVAAYTGSLVGAQGGSEDDNQSPPLPDVRPAGVILAVRIARPTNGQLVVSDLRNGGAEDIERAEGEWRDGDWVGFDPVATPRRISA